MKINSEWAYRDGDSPTAERFVVLQTLLAIPSRTQPCEIFRNFPRRNILRNSNLSSVNIIVLVRISIPSIRRWITKIATWLSLHSCCCFVYGYSQMPRLSNWTKGSQQLLPLDHTCILHNPMEKEKVWVSQANHWTYRARSYSLLEEPKSNQFRFD